MTKYGNSLFDDGIAWSVQEEGETSYVIFHAL